MENELHSEAVILKMKIVKTFYFLAIEYKFEKKLWVIFNTRTCQIDLYTDREFLKNFK